MNRLIGCAQAGAIVVERSDLATLAVTGPDRMTWFNGLVTCDLARLAPGAMAHGLALNKKGRVLTEVIAAASADTLFAGIDSAAAPTLREEFDGFLIMEDAELAMAAPPRSWFSILGPRAAEVAERIAGIEGAIAAPSPWLGHPGAFACVPASASEKLADVIAQLGDQVASASMKEFEMVRIDLGIPRFGLDYGDSTYALEAGLEAYVVSFNKGCYLGQEVVVKMRSRGKATKLLARLRTPMPCPSPGDRVTAKGEPAGTITSAAPSQLHDGQCLAFALLRAAEAEPGTMVEVGGKEATVRRAYGLDAD